MMGTVGLCVLAAGCSIDESYRRVQPGAMDRLAVHEAFGPEAVERGSGYSLDARNPWPTVVGFSHVAVAEDDPAEWKLHFEGSVAHLIVFQTLSVSVRYEGPLDEDLLRGLRAPRDDLESEFRAGLVDFVAARARKGMTEPWTDAEALKKDRYRGRFLALFESTLSDLRGRGRLAFDRFSAHLDAGTSSLELRYVGSGLYRLQMRGSCSLGPLPVL
jgi:hypothetical protein